jgi:hypothetical protein
MTNVRVTGNVHEFSPAVAAAFDAALRRSLEDVRFGFKYPLLRLELAGLTMEDVEELRGLARLVFRREDIGEAASTLRGRPSASPLALAITDVVSATRPPVDQRMVLLGAILGAHAAHHALQESGQSGPLTAIVGAITGAVAASMTDFIRTDTSDRAWQRFAEPEPTEP